MDGLPAMSPRVLIRIGSALAMGALLLLTGACAGEMSAGGADEPPPRGVEVFRGEGFSFWRPAEWAITKEPDAVGGQRVFAEGRPGQGGLPPQVGIGYGPRENTFEDVLRAHKDDSATRYANYRVRGEEDLEIEGSERARRIEATYDLALPGREMTTIRAVDVLVLTRDGRQMDFFVQAPESDFDAARLGDLGRSLRLG